MLMIGSGIYLVSGFSMRFWPEGDLRQFEAEMWNPPAVKAAEEIEIYRGGWLKQLPDRMSTAAAMETQVFLFFFFWRAGSLMLIGMALFKMGVLSSLRSSRFYATLIGLACAVGLPVITYGVYRNFESGWTVDRFFLGAQYNYWASLLVALGWVGVVMLLCRKKILQWLTQRLAAVGRMALSNYLLESILCTTVFYGHGLGLFGQVSRAGQILVVIPVWIVLMTVSPLWLRRFRYGPFEWLWRSLTYWTILPIRH
jgi:uncharacterized protein